MRFPFIFVTQVANISASKCYFFLLFEPFTIGVFLANTIRRENWKDFKVFTANLQSYTISSFTLGHFLTNPKKFTKCERVCKRFRKRRIYESNFSTRLYGKVFDMCDMFYKVQLVNFKRNFYCLGSSKSSSVTYLLLRIEK